MENNIVMNSTSSLLLGYKGKWHRLHIMMRYNKRGCLMRMVTGQRHLVPFSLFTVIILYFMYKTFTKRDSSTDSVVKRIKDMRPTDIKLYRDTQTLFETPQKRIPHEDAYEVCHTRLPHAIIIGLAKCGSKAVLMFMSVHPDISVVKKPDEVHFFDRNYEKGLEWYRDQMPCSFEHQLTVEKTPTYFTDIVLNVPEKVFKMNSSIKLLLVVREPVERSMSLYLERMHTGEIASTVSFEEAVLTKDGKVNATTDLLTGAWYHVYYKEWLRFFKPDQLHIVDGDRFIRYPVQELNQIERFLGVRSYISESHFVYNESKQFYCIKSQTKAECLGDWKGRKHPEMDPEVREKLVEFYRPHNEEFFTLIGRRFDW